MVIATAPLLRTLFIIAILNSSLSLNFRFWKIMFTLVVPVILAVVIVYGWVDHEKLSYEGKDFPASVKGFGWAIEVGKFWKGPT